MQSIDSSLQVSLRNHRVKASDVDAVTLGQVRYAPKKSIWIIAMAASAIVGGLATFSWPAFFLFVFSTAIVLLFGHSLGSHRKLIHNSFACSKPIEYLLVYLGVQVGLAGPIGLLRQHDLRDFAQRLPTCHDYLRHGRSFWRDGWWQLHCDLYLDNPPRLEIEKRIADDPFYRWLERTWMWQQLPWAVLFFLIGGVSFVFWGVCARVTAGVVGHWLIGYFAHNMGGMSHEVRDAAVQGRNVPLTSLLTMGECWHNNHHAYPGSAKLGLRAGEWDPGWWMLSLMRRLGIVWNVRLPHDLAQRTELVAIKPAALHVPQRTSVAMTIALARAKTPSLFPALLSWPAFYISKKTMHRLTGNAVALTSDRSHAVLRLKLNCQELVGLPALYVAMTRKSHVLGYLAWILGPIAVGIERLRPNNWRMAA